MKTIQDGPLAQALAQDSAEWLEANSPLVYAALEQELLAGRTQAELRSILRRTFGPDLRDAFVLRVLQAAEYLRSIS